MANLIRKTSTKFDLNWPRFVKDMTKTFWFFFFWFTVLTAVHLQNTNAKFHKVGCRHYSGEAENVYISVQQIYSGQYVSNFISRSGFVDCISKKKHFGVFIRLQCTCITNLWQQIS